jgi:hypothetical protein
MAADLMIYVVNDNETQKHVEQYLQKEYWSSDLGACYDLFKLKEDGNWYRDDDLPKYVWDDNIEFWDVVTEKKVIQLNFDEDKIYDLPCVWVGEVSWLKASLLGSSEAFIPSTIMKVSELIDGLTDINEELIVNIKESFGLENKTTYDLNSLEDVVNFLQEHVDKKAFCISV